MPIPSQQTKKDWIEEFLGCLNYILPPIEGESHALEFCKGKLTLVVREAGEPTRTVGLKEFNGPAAELAVGFAMRYVVAKGGTHAA